MHEQTAAVTKGLWYGYLRDKEGYAIRMVGPASKGQVERTLKKLNAETDLETEWFSLDYAMTDFRSDLQDGISALQFKRLPPDDKRRLVHLMDLYQVRNEGKSKSARIAQRSALATSSALADQALRSRFEEGKPADPTKNMDPEDAKEWEQQTEEHKDEFKSAASGASKSQVKSWMRQNADDYEDRKTGEVNTTALAEAADFTKGSSNPGGHSNEDVGYVDIRLSKTAGRKPRDTMERHQLKILLDTVRNPMKSLLGGPDAEEAEATLRADFNYSDAEIRRLKQAKTAGVGEDMIPQIIQDLSRVHGLEGVEVNDFSRPGASTVEFSVFAELRVATSGSVQTRRNGPYEKKPLEFQADLRSVKTTIVSLLKKHQAYDVLVVMPLRKNSAQDRLSEPGPKFYDGSIVRVSFSLSLRAAKVAGFSYGTALLSVLFVEGRRPVPFNIDTIQDINRTTIPIIGDDGGEHDVELKVVDRQYSGSLTQPQEKLGWRREVRVDVQHPVDEGGSPQTSARAALAALVQVGKRHGFKVEPVSRGYRPETRKQAAADEAPKDELKDDEEDWLPGQKRGEWNIIISKYSATRWNYFTKNPSGGGGGSGAYPSAKAAFAAGTRVAWGEPSVNPGKEKAWVIEQVWDGQKEDYVIKKSYWWKIPPEKMAVKFKSAALNGPSAKTAAKVEIELHYDSPTHVGKIVSPSGRAEYYYTLANGAKMVYSDREKFRYQLRNQANVREAEKLVADLEKKLPSKTASARVVDRFLTATR